MHFDGWFDTLEYVLDQALFHNVTEAGGAFADSTSALEDALGLTTAITMGLFWGGYTSPELYKNLQPGIHACTRIRLGPASLWGLIYLIPPLISVGILVYMVSTSWIYERRQRRNA